MRTIFLCLLLLPIFATAQNQRIYLSLTDGSGVQLEGEVVVKGYEKTAEAHSINKVNDGQIDLVTGFTIVSPALKAAVRTGKTFKSVLISVVSANQGRLMPVYTIKMEDIFITAFNETMNCNSPGMMSISLNPIRIGWTYYKVNLDGSSVVSSKNGYDFSTKKPWKF